MLCSTGLGTACAIISAPALLPLGRRFPVVLAVAPSSAAARQRAAGGPGAADPGAALPLLGFALATQAGGARGRSFYPFIGLRSPHALQVGWQGVCGVGGWPRRQFRCTWSFQLICRSDLRQLLL